MSRLNICQPTKKAIEVAAYLIVEKFTGFPAGILKYEGMSVERFEHVLSPSAFRLASKVIEIKVTLDPAFSGKR